MGPSVKKINQRLFKLCVNVCYILNKKSLQNIILIGFVILERLALKKRGWYPKCHSRVEIGVCIDFEASYLLH